MIRIEDMMSRYIFTVSYSLPYNNNMREPRCIRFFYNEQKANVACEFIKSKGFDCFVKEDMFEKLTLDKLGFRRRFRLYVEMNDINPIAELLAKKLKTKR